MKNFDLIEKIFIYFVVFIFIFGLVLSVFEQEKISKADTKIETVDRIYYTNKESLKFYENMYCVDFYNLNEESSFTHCGQYTIKYIK